MPSFNLAKNKMQTPTDSTPASGEGTPFLRASKPPCRCTHKSQFSAPITGKSFLSSFKDFTRSCSLHFKFKIFHCAAITNVEKEGSG